MSEFIQVGGALLVLAAFTLAQARRINTQAGTYLLLNAVGASVLAVEAYLDAQWGFLLLEGVWAAIAAWGLSRSLMTTRARGARAGT